MRSVDLTPELRDWTVWKNRTVEDLGTVFAPLKVPRKVRGLHQSGIEGVQNQPGPFGGWWSDQTDP